MSDAPPQRNLSGTVRPAEWQPQTRVWVSPPHNEETWPGSGVLDRAQAQFGDFLDELSKVVEVADVGTHGIATEDSWIRDYGPLFVLCHGVKRIRAFGFNAWGCKYGTGELDAQTPAKIGRAMGFEVDAVPLVLEGGAIESDGRGTGMTTASCLYHPSRNPGKTHAQIEQTVCEALGFERLLVLPGGDVPGDDTDGHVDNLVRFLTPELLAVCRAEASQPAYAVTEANWAAAEAAGGYELLPLPVPEPVEFEYPGDRWTPARRELLPASHANFLMCNGAVFVPVFGQPSDDVACQRLDDALGPAWRIVPVRSEWLVVGQGVVHCLTQQECEV